MLISLVLPSCSLKYEEELNTSSSFPELELTNAEYSCYEDNSLSMQLTADSLEQYKSGGSYAQRVKFCTWDKEQKLTTEGTCNLLGIQDDEKIYTLFDNIYINNEEQKFKIRAQNLKWNGNTKQLVSGENDTVFVTRDDIEIEGSGFSASGSSRSFRFTKPVKGIITTADEVVENAVEEMSDFEILQAEEELKNSMGGAENENKASDQ